MSRTLAGLLADAAQHHPRRLALLDTATGLALDHGGLARTVAAAAGRMTGLGARPGDRVVVHARNGAEHVVALLACSHVGLVHVGLPLGLPAEGHERLLTLVEPRLVLAQPDLRGAAPGLAAALDAGEVLLAPGRPDDEREGAGAVVSDPDSTHALVATSGSTGLPKLVRVTGRMVTTAADAYAGALDLGPDDVTAVHLPLWWVSGHVTQLATALRSGGALVTMPTWSPAGLLRVSRAHAVTWWDLVPTMWPPLLREGLVDLPCLRAVVFGGAPASPEVLAAVSSRLTQVRLVDAYAMSECPAPVAVRDVRSGAPDGCVGPPLPHARVAVVGADGSQVPTGCEGAVVVESAAVTPGYGGPDRLDVDGAGRLRTGDLGMMDADGRLVLTGRATDLVVRGGVKVHPREVERALVASGTVLDALAVALPSVAHGQVVGAVVVLPDGAGLDVAGLRRAVTARVGAHAAPARLLGVAQVPTNRNGKPDRAAARELLLAPVEPVGGVGGETEWTAGDVRDMLSVAARSPTVAAVAATEGGARVREGQYDFVVVANRLPVDKVGATDDGEPLYEASPGGLVTALAPVMRSQHGAWVGWAGAPDEAGDAFDSDGMHLVPVELSAQEIEDYYEGMSNGTLWPLFHDVIAAPEYHRHWWDAYRRVNRRFAEAAAAQADHGATVWVQDYQLLLVPAMLREQRPDLRIGFFNHIPFPGYEIFSQLPWRKQVVEGVLGADLVGFQRRSDATNFLRACRRAAGASTRGSTVHVGHGGPDGDGYRNVRAAAFPISIDARGFEELSRTPAVVERSQEIRKELGEPDVVLLGVDRLDYTKGIRHRLSIVKELLEDGALGDRQAVLVQVASPSRERVKAYSDLRDEVELIVGRLNGDHGTVGRQPVHYLHQSFPREEMAALLLAADVMLVTALRDGMNLVAKEYVAARHDDDGVLVLSEFAGAADELTQAVVMNPHDIDGAKAAIVRAVDMPKEERRRRMRALRRRVREHDVERWAREFLGVLQGRAGAADGGSGIESGSGEQER